MTNHNNLHDGYGGLAREGHQIANDNQLEVSRFVDSFSPAAAAKAISCELKLLANATSQVVGKSGLGTERVIHYESVVLNAAAAIKDLSLILRDMEGLHGQETIK